VTVTLFFQVSYPFAYCRAKPNISLPDRGRLSPLNLLSFLLSYILFCRVQILHPSQNGYLFPPPPVVDLSYAFLPGKAIVCKGYSGGLGCIFLAGPPKTTLCSLPVAIVRFFCSPSYEGMKRIQPFPCMFIPQTHECFHYMPPLVTLTERDPESPLAHVSRLF